MITTRDRRVDEIVERNNKIRENWKKLGKYGFSPVQFPPFSPDGKKFFYEVVPDGAWKGSRCFIVGGGPSLKGFNFSKLKNELTIGINRAYEAFDCTIAFSMDFRYFQWIMGDTLGRDAKRKFVNFRGYKVWTAANNYPYPDGIYQLHCVGSREFSYSMQGGLGSGANSGYAALNLAVCLGANPIYLLGFDMWGQGGRQAWWHDGYPSKQPAAVYKKFMDYFNKIAPELKARGIRVINLNPSSALKCFEFGKFEDIKPYNFPIFISYYTKNTGYEEEAKKLGASLRRFNLEHDIEAIDSLGSWQKNTHYKARFIKKMLKKHSSRSVLFIDCDAVIKSFPFLFRNLKADMACSFRDYAEFPISSRKSGKELLSGTLYFANNENAYELIDSWIEENDDFPTIWEQKNLAEMVEVWDGKIKELPPQYCKIYDSMKSVENPVIEHYQASRRYRNAL